MRVPSLDFTRDEVESIFEQVDIDRSGQLSYSQFLIATLDPALLTDEALLERHFRDLDTLKEGFLTPESLLLALKRKGHEISLTAVEEALEKQALEADRKITLEILKQLLF